MKQNRIMFAALALTALLMSSCDKEPQSFSSFTLSTADFTNANGTKAYWDANGYWWENVDSSNVTCDKVLINGKVHKVFHDNTNHKWKTKGEGVAADGGYFYVVYDGSVSSGKWNKPDAHQYGLVDFNNCSFVPLAAMGQGNSLTLYPCCAVIKMATDAYGESISVSDVDGNIYSKGYIDAEEKIIVDGAGSEKITSGALPEYSGTQDDGYIYFIVPMGGEYVTCTLETDWGNVTTQTLQKGVVYVIN